MKIKIKYLLLIISCFIFASCSFYTQYLQSGSKKFPETNPDSIKIYSGDIEREYIVIGSVASESTTSFDAAEHLKQETSKIGANAIIFVKLTKMNSFARRVGISGVAVRFKE